MLGGADNPNGELPSYITGADRLGVTDGIGFTLTIILGDTASFFDLHTSSSARTSGTGRADITTGIYQGFVAIN